MSQIVLDLSETLFKKIIMNFIKKILTSILMSTLVLTGCQEYDDTEITNRVDNLESQVAELRSLVEKLNSNLTSLVTAVDALNNQDEIVSVEKLPAGNGYTITFKKSGTITIYNGEKGLDGKNGTDGTDGKSPVISIRQDTDGKYYWTLDGEWLLVNNQKVPATAEVTVPKIKVEDGKFLFSTNGTDWVVIGDAGTSGIGLIKNVREDNENNTIIIELSDREIVIPKGQSFALVIKTDEIGIKAGETVSVDYSLVAAENAIVKVLPENGYTVTVNPASGTQGTLGITAPSPVVNASILVVAVNGNGVMSGKILTVSEGKLEVKADATPVSADGGSVTVQITTNLDYEIVIPENAKSWVTLVQTKALRTDKVTFSVAPNTEASQRAAEIEVRVDGAKVQTFNIVQQGKTSSQDTWASADLKSLYQDESYLASPNSFGNFTSANNWKTTNTSLIEIENNTYKDESIEAIVGLRGSTNAQGKLESPFLSKGCKKLQIQYGYHTMPKSMSKGISINVIVANKAGTELYNGNITVDYGDGTAFANLRNKKQTWEINDLNIDGDFKITIKNNSPSNKTSFAFDLFDILSISWIPYSN